MSILRPLTAVLLVGAALAIVAIATSGDGDAPQMLTGAPVPPAEATTPDEPISAGPAVPPAAPPAAGRPAPRPAEPRPATPPAQKAQPTDTKPTRVVVGRVVDEIGRVVLDARVEIIDEADGPADADANGIIMGKNLGTVRGHYEHRVRGDSVLISAHAPRIGTARWRRYPVGGTRCVLPDLVLEGGFAIEGVAVFPNGEPVPHLRVRVTRKDDGGESYLRTGLSPAGAGTTDARGAFRFAGLAEGDYTLWSEQGSTEESTPLRVRAGGPPVRLKVRSPMIAMHAVDETGRAIREGSFTVFSWAPPHADRIAAQHRADAIAPDAPPPWEQSCWLSGRAYANAFVEADRFFLIRYAPDGFEPQLHGVRLGRNAWHATVRFEPRKLRNAAVVTVDLRFPGGQSVAEFEATLTPIDASRFGASTDLVRIGEAQTFPPVPPGRYRIEVEPSRHSIQWKAFLGSNANHCWKPVSRDVTVGPGASTIRLRTARCAVIRVSPPWPVVRHDIRIELRRGDRIVAETIEAMPYFEAGQETRWFFVEPGRWTIRATTTDKPAVVATLEARAGRFHPVDLE